MGMYHRGLRLLTHEGKPDPCPSGTPIDFFPVRDVTPKELRSLTLAVWRLEHHRYVRADWGNRGGASSYQGKGV